MKNMEKKKKIKYKKILTKLMIGREIPITKTNEKNKFKIRNNKRKKSGIKYTNILRKHDEMFSMKNEEALTTWVINIGMKLLSNIIM